MTKNFRMRKVKSFIDNRNLKEGYLGKKKFHFNESNIWAFAKNLLNYTTKQDWADSPNDLGLVSDLPFEDCEIKSLHKDLKRVFHSSKYNWRAKVVPNYIRISDIDQLDYGHLNINSVKNCFSIFLNYSKDL